MDLYGPNPPDAGPVYQRPCNSRPDQLWSWWHQDGDPADTWRIAGTKDRNCLDTTGDENLSKIVHRTCGAGDRSQMWYWRSTPGGNSLVNASSAKCIDLPAFDSPTAQLIQRACEHIEDQIWTLRRKTDD